MIVLIWTCYLVVSVVAATILERILYQENHEIGGRDLIGHGVAWFFMFVFWPLGACCGVCWVVFSAIGWLITLGR